MHNERVQKVRKGLRLFLAVIIFGGLGNFVFQNFLSEKKAVPVNGTELQSLLKESLRGTELDTRQKDGGCKILGPFPDHLCTPGAIFPEAATDEICKAGYTKTVRAVPINLKKEVYTEYNISYPQPAGYYEADHLIPLELGGSNDIANLFPEAADPSPGFKEKDIVENYLHQEVCAGRTDLALAQVEIADNWLAIYNSLTPEEISTLKQKFTSWAR